MRNKLSTILFTSLISISLSTSLIASTKLSAPEKINSALTYDADNGWWWYKEEYKTPDGKTFEVKEKISIKEKMKMEQSKKIEKLLKVQNKKIDKLQDRLDYAFPNLAPKYTKNEKTGEKCLTNSSTDCFVFPLQPEALHLPVLAGWLSDPSPTNSKKWLKWEAKYFNHISRISYGNRLAFLDDGGENYPTITTNVYGDSIFFGVSDKQKAYREVEVLKKLKDKLGLIVFMGATTLRESTQFAYRDMRFLNREPWKSLDVSIIIPSKKIKDMIIKSIEKTNDQTVLKFWTEKVNLVIQPSAFTKFNIEVTPTVVALFQTDKENEDGSNKVIWQKIQTGPISLTSLRSSVSRFLIYNNILKPSEFTSDKNSASIQKNLKRIVSKIDGSKTYKDANYISVEE